MAGSYARIVYLRKRVGQASRQKIGTPMSEHREVTFIVGDQWPTPTNCRRAADALDAITPARFGDILRAYADAEDARFDRSKRTSILSGVVDQIADHLRVPTVALPPAFTPKD